MVQQPEKNITIRPATGTIRSPHDQGRAECDLVNSAAHRQCKRRQEPVGYPRVCRLSTPVWWYVCLNSDAHTSIHHQWPLAPASGARSNASGSFTNVGTAGYNWSSTAGTSGLSYNLNFTATGLNTSNSNNRANGFPVRCCRQAFAAGAGRIIVGSSLLLQRQGTGTATAVASAPSARTATTGQVRQLPLATPTSCTSPLRPSTRATTRTGRTAYPCVAVVKHLHSSSGGFFVGGSLLQRQGAGPTAAVASPTSARPATVGRVRQLPMAAPTTCALPLRASARATTITGRPAYPCGAVVKHLHSSPGGFFVGSSLRQGTGSTAAVASAPSARTATAGRVRQLPMATPTSCTLPLQPSARATTRPGRPGYPCVAVVKHLHSSPGGFFVGSSLRQGTGPAAAVASAASVRTAVPGRVRQLPLGTPTCCTLPLLASPRAAAPSGRPVSPCVAVVKHLHSSPGGFLI